MNLTYDTIIWGPSLVGISRAIQLKRQGRNLLLAGKFGFPGGKATESLAVLFSEDFFEQDEVLKEILATIEPIKFGVLYRNKPWLLLHPEAVKRACWEVLRKNNIELIFHVIPLRVKQDAEPELELFGREGKLSLRAREIIDLSDDSYLGNLDKASGECSVIINSFFSDPLPPVFPGSGIRRKIDTAIGQFVSFQVKNVPSGSIEKVFNRELDLLVKQAWSKHQARISMIPVYPEIVFVNSSG